MRTLVKCLCLVALVFLVGCAKKVSEENAKKVQPGMSRAEVEAILGSGRKDGDRYVWTTEKGGKLKISFTDDKVTRIENEGAPKVETAEDKAATKAAQGAAEVERKKELDRLDKDRDRINALNDVYALLFAAVGVADRLPANEAALAASPLANVNTGLEAVRSGRVVVRWGAAISDAIWAYEKDGPTKGGYAVGEKFHTAELLTAEQLRPFVTK